MKCEKCKNEIEDIELNRFNHDGSDSYIYVPIAEFENNVTIIETDNNWTGHDLSKSEQLETILCPICGEFPFKHKEIQVHEIVQLACFKSTN